MLREEKGAVAIIVAILIVVLLGFAALVIDVGALYEERRQNQTAADAAALAGAQELPDSPGSAEAKAIEYADKNNRTITASDVDITTTYVSYDTIKVTVKSTVNYTFARVLGFSSGEVPADATAIVGSPNTFGGTKLMPWARMDESFTFGIEYPLFLSDDPITGNFQAIQLPYIDPDTNEIKRSPGMVEYADLVAGVNNQGQPFIPADVELHQLIETKTGNFGVNTANALAIRFAGHESCTFSDIVNSEGNIIDMQCPRIVVVVSVVNPNGTWGGENPDNHADDTLLWPTGTSSPVEVERFNYFFVSSYVASPSEGGVYVWGTYIRALTAEETKIGRYDPKSGIKVVKLIQ